MIETDLSVEDGVSLMLSAGAWVPPEGQGKEVRVAWRVHAMAWLSRR